MCQKELIMTAAVVVAISSSCNRDTMICPRKKSCFFVFSESVFSKSLSSFFNHPWFSHTTSPLIVGWRVRVLMCCLMSAILFSPSSACLLENETGSVYL